MSIPDSHGYTMGGMAYDSGNESWPNKAMTRADARYMIFWVIRDPDQNTRQRCCFPTLPEALRFADEHHGWLPSHIVDMRSYRLAHQFPLAGITL